MNLPSEAELINGLEKWRQRYLENVDIETLYENYQKVDNSISDRLKKSGFKTMINTQGEDRKLSYRELKSLFQIYKIDCVDLFLDFCRKPTLGDISVVRAPWNSKSIQQSGSGEAQLRYAHRDSLKMVRTRVDIVDIKPFSKTTWLPHNGHEFALVGKGDVVAVFSKEESGDREEFSLAKDDAIAFPSWLWHQFENRSKESAQIYVGRPARSLPVTPEGT